MEVDKAAEIVLIPNQGAAAVDLSGWWLASLRGGQAVQIPAGTVLEPGAILKISAAGEPGDVTFGAGHVWHNELHDSAELRRQDGRVVLFWDDPAEPG